MSRFDSVAKDWDSKSKRLEIARSAVQAIKEQCNLKQKRILDYGCGTGLLGFGLSDEAKELVGMDSSRGMLDVFEKKAKELGFQNISCQFHDAHEHSLQQQSFDSIVSSMTLHHIKDPASFMQECAAALTKEGSVCMVDLDKEDGSFHSDNSGVEHFGFCHDDIEQLMQQAGLEVTFLQNIHHISKEGKDYGVFLCIAKKRHVCG